LEERQVKPTKDSEVNQMAEKRNLRRGMQGEDVKKLQEDLKAIGYDPGEADGIFGKKTEDAVKKFQKDKGLRVDGVVGKNTATYIDALNLLKKTSGMLKKVWGQLCKAQQEEFAELVPPPST
jgi:peptidoglycan hydrolase-like protein with peptidoglycan-binding domain